MLHLFMSFAMMSDMKKSKPVTQSDVAKEAGVSRSMVSYVLNDTQGKTVAEETKKRILDAIEKLAYRPNKYAQALQLGQSAFGGKQIGVIMSGSQIFLRPYYMEILSGIHKSALEKKHQIRFIVNFEDLKNPILFNELISAEMASGLILIAPDQCVKTERDFALAKKMQERISNIVCVDSRLEGFSCARFSRRQAASQACSYLVKKGFKKIAYVGALDERVSGFKQTLLESSLKNSDPEILGALDMEGGYYAASKLSEKRELPDAVLAGSDEVAIGVLRLLDSKSVEVPRQVALVSIDNIELSAYTNPPLTTVNVEKAAMGRHAVEMIVHGNVGFGKDAVDILLPLTLVERESA